MKEVIQTRIVENTEGEEYLEYLTTDGKRYRHSNHVRDITDERYFAAGKVSIKKLTK